MTPGVFGEMTKVLTAPDGVTADVGPLPVWTDGKQYVSKWEPTFRERLAILFGAEIWLSLLTAGGQPPVALTVEKPEMKKARP